MKIENPQQKIIPKKYIDLEIKLLKPFSELLNLTRRKNPKPQKKNIIESNTSSSTLPEYFPGWIICKTPIPMNPIQKHRAGIIAEGNRKMNSLTSRMNDLLNSWFVDEIREVPSIIDSISLSSSSSVSGERLSRTILL